MKDLSIQDFMTDEQKNDYQHAAALTAACILTDRALWERAIEALRKAEEKAIHEYVGPIHLNRFGRYSGGVHPALKGLKGYLHIWLEFTIR